ncbi:MAG: NYN domain-containing protein, partial [Acidobacteriota bacterium]|nr:NYN domain-containing protein [Acidobacteriota bacterium]
MPWVFDGDNLLGTWPGRKRDDRGRRSIAGELRRFGAVSKRRIFIVFDGSPRNRESFGRCVHFPAAGESADDWILAHLRKQDEVAGWTVVTSDRS